MSRIVKTVITVTVLHQAYGMDDGWVENMSLSEVADFIDDGAGIGATTVVSNKVLPVGEVRSELLAIGNDGEFFDLTELEGYDFGPLPVIVTLDRKDAKPGERASDFIGRFASEDIASSFLSLSATIDPDALSEGRYNILTMEPGDFTRDEPVIFTETDEPDTPQPGVVIAILPAGGNEPGTGDLYEVRLDSGAVVTAFPNELTPVATELPDGIDI